MASVLETFFFLFESDASKLDKGLKDSEKGADRLKDKIDDVDDAANMAGGSLLKMATKVGAAIGSFMAVSAIKAAIHQTAMEIDDLGDAAAALNLPVEELSAWSMAATMSDGTQQGFIASLNAINVGMNSIATKGKGLMLPFLGELGLSLSDVKRAAKDPIWALEQMSDRFSKLSKAEAAGLGSKIGLDQGTINLLAQGRRGLDELIARQKEMGVVTTAQAEAAGKYDEQLKKNAATYADIKRELVVSVLPVVTWFLETLRKGVKWMGDNQGFVVGFFGAIAAVLTALYLPAAIAAAAATWTLIAPFVGLALGVAAFAAILALVADDLYNFMRGNDSVIGEIAKKWPIVGDVIHGVGDTLLALIETVRAFGAFFVDLITLGPQKAIENFAGSIENLVADISSRWPKVGEVFGAVTGTMTDAIDVVVRAWQWLVDKVSAGIELFAKAASVITAIPSIGAKMLGFGVAPDTRDSVAAGQRHIALANSPIASQTSNSIANSSRTANRTTTVQTGPITVQTASTDGAGVGRALASSLNDHIKGAIDQHDDGVAA